MSESSKTKKKPKEGWRRTSGWLRVPIHLEHGHYIDTTHTDGGAAAAVLEQRGLQDKPALLCASLCLGLDYNLVRVSVAMFMYDMHVERTCGNARREQREWNPNCTDIAQ